MYATDSGPFPQDIRTIGVASNDTPRGKGRARGSRSLAAWPQSYGATVRALTAVSPA